MKTVTSGFVELMSGLPSGLWISMIRLLLRTLFVKYVILVSLLMIMPYLRLSGGPRATRRTLRAHRCDRPLRHLPLLVQMLVAMLVRMLVATAPPQDRTAVGERGVRAWRLMLGKGVLWVMVLELRVRTVTWIC